MLEMKLDTLSVDKMGRVITVKDVTGVYDAVDNPGGYGGVNLSPTSVQGLMYTISNYNSSKVHYVLVERTPGTFPPDTCFVLMDIDAVMGGEEVQLTTTMFDITNPEQGVGKFNDGVIDVNYFAYTSPISATGVKGENYLSGSSLIALQDIDAVLIGTKMYVVDHNKPVGDGSIMFLTERLEQDVTSINPSYRVNTKVYMDKRSKCILSRKSAELAGGGCEDGVLKKRLLIIKHNRDASKLDWCEEDYAGADQKLRYAQSLLSDCEGIC